MKKFSLLITLIGSFLCSRLVIAEEVPGKALLSYFSSSCKTSSQWTQVALADSEALIKSLNAMVTDPDCASAAGAISQLNSLSTQLATLDKLNESKKTMANINAEEQELLVQLTKTTDSGVTSQINSTLMELQVNRAKILNGDKSSEKLSGVDKVILLGQIAQSANSSFAQITSNEKCLNKHPALLNTVTSIVSGVGTAVTLINPAIGVAMTAGATFTKIAMDGIKSSKHARRIRKIADSTITFEAYSCALESMSERWCQMTDAESFLKFKADNRREVSSDPDLAQAIILNDREIPVILDWLNRIRNGVAPRTTADAQRRGMVLTRELMVRSSSDYGQSLIEQNRKTYESLNNKPDDQWNMLKNIIISIKDQFANDAGANNPLKEIYDPGYAPYYLLGLKLDDPRIRNPETKDFFYFNSWEKPADIVATLDAVKGAYIQWIDQATDLVNRELTEVQQPDALQTLSSANIESEPWLVTPIDAFKTIADFLENNQPNVSQRDFKKIYLDTIQKLREIHDITLMAILTGETTPQIVEGKVSKLSPIEQIYEIAQLKYGVVVLQSRLEMIMRISLLEYIKRSSDEDQIFLAQLLASDRFYETISKMNGTANYAVLRKDIRTGQAYTMQNLSSFMDIFGSNINRTLSSLFKEEQLALPTAAKARRDLRTSLCFLVLGAENVGKWIDVKLCSGLKMEAVQPGGPESITLDSSIFSQDLAKRACTYREFFRQSEIYQKWRIKNP